MWVSSWHLWAQDSLHLPTVLRESAKSSSHPAKLCTSTAAPAPSSFHSSHAIASGPQMQKPYFLWSGCPSPASPSIHASPQMSPYQRDFSWAIKRHSLFLSLCSKIYFIYFFLTTMSPDGSASLPFDCKLHKGKDLISIHGCIPHNP